jgi:hypothetical protein
MVSIKAGDVVTIVGVDGWSKFAKATKNAKKAPMPTWYEATRHVANEQGEEVLTLRSIL